MKRLKKWWNVNKENILMSMGVALAVKLAGDFGRTYSAFGGEDLLFVAVVGYWIWNFVEFRGAVKNGH